MLKKKKSKIGSLDEDSDSITKTASRALLFDIAPT
jgi:hypothetical protein